MTKHFNKTCLIRQEARKHFDTLLAIQGNKCAECGEPMDISKDPEGKHGRWRATIEHKIRIVDGGTNDLNNLELMHQRCNVKKNNKLQTRRLRKCNNCGGEHYRRKANFCYTCEQHNYLLFSGVGLA